jgi:hypothetical protein
MAPTYRSTLQRVKTGARYGDTYHRQSYFE